MVVGSKSFLRTCPPPSLATVILKLLLELTMSIAIYNVQRTRPSLDIPAGDMLSSVHTSTLSGAPFFTLCGIVVVYKTVT